MKNKIWKAFGIFGMIVLAGLIIGIILVSMGGARQKAYYRPGYPPAMPLKAPSPFEALSPLELGKKEIAEQPSPEVPSRLVIKTGTVNMLVRNVRETARKIIEWIENKGGWVVSSSISEVKEIPSGAVTVRVPAKNFDEAMRYFRGLAEKVTYESTRGQDVTEEYVDLQSRLRNLEATETQLLKIMERSGNISDVLAVQKELQKVREDIERTKGRIQYLEQNVRMATITVNLALSEELLPIPPAEKWRPKYILLTSWKGVIGFWRGFSHLLIRVMVWAMVWVPFGAAIWYGRKIWRKRKEVRKV